MFGFDNEDGGRMAAFFHINEDEADPDILILKELKEHNKQMKELIKAINRLAGRIK